MPTPTSPLPKARPPRLLVPPGRSGLIAERAGRLAEELWAKYGRCAANVVAGRAAGRGSREPGGEDLRDGMPGRRLGLGDAAWVGWPPLDHVRPGEAALDRNPPRQPGRGPRRAAGGASYLSA